MRVVLVVNRLINKVKNKQMVKDLNYWKNNCADDYIMTPISVLRYITELEKKVEETINPTRCCDKLKDKEAMTFSEWIVAKDFKPQNDGTYLRGITSIGRDIVRKKYIDYYDSL